MKNELFKQMDAERKRRNSVEGRAQPPVLDDATYQKHLKEYLEDLREREMEAPLTFEEMREKYENGQLQGLASEKDFLKKLREIKHQEGERFQLLDFGITDPHQIQCPNCGHPGLHVDLENGEEHASWHCDSCTFNGRLDYYNTEVGPSVLTALELFDPLLDYYMNGMKPGTPTGWPLLDELFKPRDGEFTIVTGLPNHGKSELLDHLAVNLACQGWAFGVFSPENRPFQMHLAKLMEKHAGAPFVNWHNRDKMTDEQLRAALNWVHSRFYFINPVDYSMRGVLDVAGKLWDKYRIRGLIIDPWNELDHSRPNNEIETEYISRQLSVLRNWARDRGIHVFLVVHPTKLGKDRQGKQQVPTPNELHGSAHFRNKADNIFTVFRNVDPDDDGNTRNEVEVHVQKVRFKVTGRLGVTTLEYIRETGQYTQNMQPPPGQGGKLHQQEPGRGPGGPF